MTKIINFDSLVKEPLVIVVIDGVKHPMAEATVETFIQNMKAVEALGLDASPIAEIEVGVGIITRAFPTLTEDQVRKWTLSQIQNLSEIARGVNGEVVSTDEQEVADANASGNVQPAS
ncbi:hypothetical protein [Agrobacterium sp. CG674]